MNLRISQPQYPITHQPYQPYQPNQQTQSPSKDNKGVEMIRSFYEDKFEPELKKS